MSKPPNLNTNNQLLTLLTTELAALQRFVELLQSEQTALIENRLDSLIDLAKTKSDLSAELESLAKIRKAAFGSLGIQISPDFPHDLLIPDNVCLDAAADVIPRWRDLLQTARQASALNQTNGSLIDTRQQQNQQLFSILRGSSSVTGYDASGQIKVTASGNRLGEA